MNLRIISLFLMTFCASFVLCHETKSSSVVFVILIRNKAHTLPYCLTYLGNLNYPKDRITLWIRTDHNEDESFDVIQSWISTHQQLYHEVDFKYEKGPNRRKEEQSMTDWPSQRFADLIQMKEEGFNFARSRWADYVMFLDADVFLTDPNTLTYLINTKLPMVAPMLLSDGLYSNFWAGVDEDFYYKRTPEYADILEYRKIGEFPVPMIHSAVLVDLRVAASDYITFDPKKLNAHYNNQNFTGPIDDMIVFGISANYSKIQMYVSNKLPYGYILVPLSADNDFYKDWHQLINIKTLIINYSPTGLLLDPTLANFVSYPEMDSLTLSKIFMINLDRRLDRRAKMESNFLELGLKVERISAVDGRNLSYDKVAEMGITIFPDYKDPYHNRPMTLGEVACFLSHYNIWKRMVDENLSEVLVLEDDIKFEPFFRHRALTAIQEARELGGWDLLYFGRKRLQDADEPVENTINFVRAGYSYWTIGYVITLEGAQKIMNSKPLERIIPVDEFLPIMFNRHPTQEWMDKFESRNLVAYSVAPLIIYPILYTGEDGYISDTEDSTLVITFNEDGSQEDVKKKGDKEDLLTYLEDEIIEELKCPGNDAKCNLLLETTPEAVGRTEL